MSGNDLSYLDKMKPAKPQKFNVRASLTREDVNKATTGSSKSPTYTLSVKVPEEWKYGLEELSMELGLSRADVIRWLLMRGKLAVSRDGERPETVNTPTPTVDLSKWAA